jgi:hypothetical protein
LNQYGKLLKFKPMATKKTITKTKEKDFDFTTIKSYEDACIRANIDPVKSLPDVKICPAFLKKFIIAAYKLAIIASAIRNGSKLDWSNGNELKYYPWHWIKAYKEHTAGFGFSFSVYSLTYMYAYIGSRLSFPTLEQALYFAENFHDIWIDFKLEIE